MSGVERWEGYDRQSWSERFAELDRRYSRAMMDAIKLAQRLTTPAQPLDAATIERCAQVADANAATSIPLMNGIGVAASVERGRWRAGTEIAAAIRALNTASTTTRGEKNDG